MTRTALSIDTLTTLVANPGVDIKDAATRAAIFCRRYDAQVTLRFNGISLHVNRFSKPTHVVSTYNWLLKKGAGYDEQEENKVKLCSQLQTENERLQAKVERLEKGGGNAAYQELAKHCRKSDATLNVVRALPEKLRAPVIRFATNDYEAGYLAGMNEAAEELEAKLKGDSNVL